MALVACKRDKCALLLGRSCCTAQADGIHTLLRQASSTGSHIHCILLRVNAGLHASVRNAGVAINAHLQQLMPPLLALASSESTALGPVAAREAINKIVAAVAEDGLYLLIAQVAAVLRSNLPCT